jgi:hypothetical protein
MDNERVARELVNIARDLVADDIDLSGLRSMTIAGLAQVVYRDWQRVNFAAKPYLQAMQSMRSINDQFGFDSGRSIVLYFLGNARSWKGPVAKAVKKELNRRLK